MKKQQFKINIEASPEKVWNTLWDDVTYTLWTAPFSEGSRAETDWKKGNKVLFLDSKNSGMVSVISENIANEYMSIKHLGTVKNGVEDTDSEETREWAGAMENYTLRPSNGGTEVTIDMDITDEFADYFQSTWPKALERLKELAEEN